MLEQDIDKVLVSSEDIKAIVERLGQEITQDYQGQEVLVVGILRGAAIFLTDLVRALDLYVEMDFMDVSSYGEAFVSSGEVRILKDLESSVEGRHVLVVEDIIDTGQTLKYLVDLFKYRQAASVKICTLLNKEEHRIVADIVPDYVGVTIPDEFVVGYGLDYKEYYRNLPYVGVLKESVYDN
ncbi:hypoxanthine phosphoribosyltransferase [Hutsoniella sourekii]|uniref:hypoxanthine phosphoribosyltransferase n=1 Tax=Hutsoniella sourekii TaxID=87650 RepID=UPI0004805A13|nr:hypoxanthine phosphoribosyltransferase [Hutsoniella sourekii]